MPGVPVQDLWDDISVINNRSSEALGYPTQKPLALLERIISASSNPGDLVLDPFCGCGTAIAAAQKLGRRWIGIDVTHLSIALQKYRLEDMFPGVGLPRGRRAAGRGRRAPPGPGRPLPVPVVGPLPRARQAARRAGGQPRRQEGRRQGHRRRHPLHRRQHRPPQARPRAGEVRPRPLRRHPRPARHRDPRGRGAGPLPHPGGAERRHGRPRR